jgi:fumarate hydratase subunit alpha
MRQIEASSIAEVVSRLSQEANFELGNDVISALRKAASEETSPLGKEALKVILENAEIARRERMPLCQDCGTAVIFLEIGQDMHIKGDLMSALNEGVRKGYQEGYLRKSMVSRPFSSRENTNTNTPPVVHVEIVPGDSLKIRLLAKGSGAENKSRLIVLGPNAGREGIINFVQDVVREAGGDPCPPLVIGLGIGGTIEKAAYMAKKALLRPVGEKNDDPEVAGLEAEILKEVNRLGIGPLGLGGLFTALGVQAEVMPTHIASLPVAVNLQCHSIRHKEAIL